MKRLTIIVGAGGTGSYLLPNLLAFYNGLAGDVENKVVLIDGDFVEDKNLLRQGFLQDSLNQYKSEALVDTYSQAYDIEVESKNMFLNNADYLLNIVRENLEDIEDVVLISCVDNNYARLRLVVGQQLIKQFYPDLEVTFVDSGNEEWHGQSIVTTMDNFTAPVLAYENGKMVVKTEAYTQAATYDNIFVRMNNWENFLTKGDHEMSCDIVTVSHPQNVATNMTASSLIITSLGRLARGHLPKNISFNAQQNKFTLYDISDKVDYIRTMTEIANFINADEQFSVIGQVFAKIHGYKNTNLTAQETAPEQALDVLESRMSELDFEGLEVRLEALSDGLETSRQELIESQVSLTSMLGVEELATYEVNTDLTFLVESEQADSVEEINLADLNVEILSENELSHEEFQALFKSVEQDDADIEGISDETFDNEADEDDDVDVFDWIFDDLEESDLAQESTNLEVENTESNTFNNGFSEMETFGDTTDFADLLSRTLGNISL